MLRSSRFKIRPFCFEERCSAIRNFKMLVAPSQKSRSLSCSRAGRSSIGGSLSLLDPEERE
jgi:hypothetical protein